MTKRTNIPDNTSVSKLVDEPSLDITVLGAIELIKMSLLEIFPKPSFVKAAIEKPTPTDSKAVENLFL